MIRTTLILLAGLAGAAEAQEAPETSAVPEKRPADLRVDAEGPTEAQAEMAESQIEETQEEAPEDGEEAPEDGEDASEDGEEASEDGDAVATPPGDTERAQIALSDAQYRQCLTLLDGLGATYRSVEPITPEDDPDCGILQPIEVSEILPGVALEPAATLRCPTVVALAQWTRDFVRPAADRLGRGDLTALRGGSGYTCRRRNNQPDGKLSQHAFGNAFDVTAFAFAGGEPLPIMPRARDGTLEESFQDAVRASACMEFTTVLGPGSDEFHDDHLHLDVVERRSGFRLCEQGRGEGDED
ncbi:extensin-like domain-containing protein [Jannaschia formosa]|uniref:extensin-like domain-containing protein n=1 Tax=Jannaschia formosa TaxID=2259592 RepID=UPI000E1B5EEF|nr:extensin family protein [Jannaschia formosa]TFL18628.1 extensin family protein [Jannaschia formosa]